MGPVTKIRGSLICIVCCILLIFPVSGHSDAVEIPAHPRDIVYKPHHYDPPDAADYRHLLADGVVAFFVEDDELPLITVSVL
ncbi:MAG TPA: hypothetical protein VLL97_04690, partial [Acidobacteriota bacterium]|nr:hypothetical protein [Acidobacteriota bacterium]